MNKKKAACTLFLFVGTLSLCFVLGRLARADDPADPTRHVPPTALFYYDAHSDLASVYDQALHAFTEDGGYSSIVETDDASLFDDAFKARSYDVFVAVSADGDAVERWTTEAKQSSVQFMGIAPGPDPNAPVHMEVLLQRASRFDCDPPDLGPLVYQFGMPPEMCESGTFAEWEPDWAVLSQAYSWCADPQRTIPSWLQRIIDWIRLEAADALDKLGWILQGGQNTNLHWEFSGTASVKVEGVCDVEGKYIIKVDTTLYDVGEMMRRTGYVMHGGTIPPYQPPSSQPATQPS